MLTHEQPKAAPTGVIPPEAPKDPRLAALYDEARNALSGQKQPESNTQIPVTNADSPSGTPQAGSETVTQEDGAASNSADATKVDFSQVKSLLASGQPLPDNLKQALQAVGLDEAILTDVAEAYKAKAQFDEKKFFEPVGGESKYKEMINWAAENWKPEEKEAYNKALSSGDNAAKEFARNALKAAYDAKNLSSATRPVSGKASVTTQGFRSKHEIQMAMKDPRYGKDTAYTNDVVSRMRVTPQNVF